MKDTQENIEVDYKLAYLKKPKWIISLIGLFLFALISYFPLTSIIDNKIHKTLKTIPGCPLEIKDYHIKFFLPRIEVERLKVPARCLKQRGEALIFPKITFHIRGLSFSPFGPSFKIDTNFKGSQISAFLIPGFGDITILMEENTIELASLKSFLPALKLAGSIKVDLHTKLSSGKIQELKLNARSNNFILPAQKVSSLVLPTMAINNFLLQVNSEKKGKLKVEKFIVGDQASPVRANFNGNIKLNQRSITSSILNLKGELAFGKKFLEDYSIIKLLMGKFDKKDNFYQIKITGPMMSPRTSSPR